MFLESKTSPPIRLRGFPGGTSGKEPSCQCRRHKSYKFDPLKKGTATHSFILAWRIPWTERSLIGYIPRGHKESDMTEVT